MRRSQVFIYSILILAKCSSLQCSSLSKSKSACKLPGIHSWCSCFQLKVVHELPYLIVAPGTTRQHTESTLYGPHSKMIYRNTSTNRMFHQPLDRVSKSGHGRLRADDKTKRIISHVFRLPSVGESYQSGASGHGLQVCYTERF